MYRIDTIDSEVESVIFLRKIRKGKERKGKERKGKERKGKERKGKERKGKERKGRERKGREGKGREGKGREGKGREGKGREGKGKETKGANHPTKHKKDSVGPMSDHGTQLRSMLGVILLREENRKTQGKTLGTQERTNNNSTHLSLEARESRHGVVDTHPSYSRCLPR